MELKTKRPLLVWIISSFILISLFLTNFYLIRQLVGANSNPVFSAQLSEMTAFDWTRKIVFGLLSLASAISLLMLRRIAFVLFSILVSLILLMVLYTFMGMGIEHHYRIQLIISLVIFLAMWAYIFYLRKKGTLT